MFFSWFDWALLGFHNIFTFVGGALAGALSVIIPIVLGTVGILAFAFWLNSRKHPVLCGILFLLALIVISIVLILTVP